MKFYSLAKNNCDYTYFAEKWAPPNLLEPKKYDQFCTKWKICGHYMEICGKISKNADRNITPWKEGWAHLGLSVGGLVSFTSSLPPPVNLGGYVWGQGGCERHGEKQRNR